MLEILHLPFLVIFSLGYDPLSVYQVNFHVAGQFEHKRV